MLHKHMYHLFFIPIESAFLSLTFHVQPCKRHVQNCFNDLVIRICISNSVLFSMLNAMHLNELSSEILGFKL
jgi:hypothetical protein